MASLGRRANPAPSSGVSSNWGASSPNAPALLPGIGRHLRGLERHVAFKGCPRVHILAGGHKVQPARGVQPRAIEQLLLLGRVPRDGDEPLVHGGGQQRALPSLAVCRGDVSGGVCRAGGCLRRARGAQLLDLCPGERAAQIRHHPSGVKQHRGVVVDVVEQEDPTAKPRNRRFHLLAIERTPGRHGCAFQAVQDAQLVAFGLQPPEEPRSHVAQRFVVQVHGVSAWPAPTRDRTLAPA